MADFSLPGHGPSTQRVKQSAQVVSSRLGDAGVLVHLQTNRIFEVNATGLRIWELAGEGRTLGEIEDTLRAEFEVDHDRLRTDLLELVGELTREELLTVEGVTELTAEGVTELINDDNAE